MALLGALCIGLNALGFTNRSLRAQVSHLLGVAYTANQMSYDLARLRLNGLINAEQAPTPTTSPPTASASRSSTPRSTTGSSDRCIAADTPPAPPELRRALQTIDRHVHGYIDQARLPDTA